jgi:hypothetical protein
MKPTLFTLFLASLVMVVAQELNGDSIANRQVEASINSKVLSAFESYRTNMVE